MNTWKVILATLVIFVAGVVAGGLLVSYTSPAPQHPRRTSAPGKPEAAARGQTNGASREPGRFPNLLNPPIPQLLRKEFLQNLDREVHLNPEQREHIEKIMSESQERNRQLWERIAPDLRKEIAEVKERIHAVLTPEQQVKFEGLMKQRPREGRRSSPPHDGPPPAGAPQPQPSAPADPPRNP